MAFNQVLREDDEWFDEDDDLDRVQRSLASIEGEDDPVVAAALLMARLVRAQGFCEGNKRTGLALAAWLLDHNGIDASQMLTRSSSALLPLLLRAARGEDVADEIVQLLVRNS